MARYPRAVLGGTFDRLHLGHEGLLDTAFRVGREVAIGLTSARYLTAHPKPDGRPLQSYPTRRRALVRWLEAHHAGRSWTVVPIDEPFGGSVGPGVSVLVVSADTVAGGRAVNAERRRRNLPTVPVVVVPLALADDLRPVSSRRIRAGEIDRRGRRVSPIRVGLRVSNPADGPVAKRAIRAVFPRARVVLRVGPPSRRRPPRRPGGRGRTLRATQDELTLTVVRRRRGGWTVTERSPIVRLPRLEVRGESAGALARGLRAVLGAPGKSRAR